MIYDKLKNNFNYNISIELKKLDYKNYDFTKVSLLVRFLKDIYTNDSIENAISISIENADNERSNLFKMVIYVKGENHVKKFLF